MHIVQMPDGQELYGMEDKAVSTSDDLITVLNIGSGGEPGDEVTTWNASTVEKFLATLIRTKLMSIQERPADMSDSEKSSYSWPNDPKEKEPPDKKYEYSSERHRHQQSSQRPRPHHHYHHHHHHRCAKQVQLEEQQQRTSISKVQKWSDDLDMETSFDNKFSEDETFQERVDERTKLTTNRTYLTTAPRRERSGENTKRTSGKRKKIRRKSRRTKKISHIDPEDLPKRARWTIIITSGLLILTCMLLVGITLRMAPVIDQMVRTKNEELMNSLNRENTPVRYYSTDS